MATNTPSCGNGADHELLAAVKELIEQQRALLELMQSNTTGALSHPPTTRAADETEAPATNASDGSDPEKSDSPVERHAHWIWAKVETTSSVLQDRCDNFVAWRLNHKEIRLNLSQELNIHHRDDAEVDIRRFWPTEPPQIGCGDMWSTKHMIKSGNGSFRTYHVELQHSLQANPCVLKLKYFRVSGSEWNPSWIPRALGTKSDPRHGIIFVVEPSWTRDSQLILDFESIALFFDALGTYQCREREDVRRDSPPRCGHEFLFRYATKWRPAEARLYVHRLYRNLDLQIHIRSFSTHPPSRSKMILPFESSGIVCHREDGAVSFKKRRQRFLERRTSLSLVIDWRARLSSDFAIVKLTDNIPRGRKGVDYHLPPVRADHRDITHESGLSGCYLLKGIVVFQMALLVTFEVWVSDWSETLTSVEDLLTVQGSNEFALISRIDFQFLSLTTPQQVSDYLTAESRKDLMYDNNQLSRSEFYFSLLQLLRQFKVSIDESLSDISKLSAESTEQLMKWTDIRILSSGEVPIIKENWEILLRKTRKEGTQLIDRITNKIEEVESLRDGLFNAQSVREAVRGTQLNTFLLVFTVVTIVYLPPTFVATFYGMDLFGDEENKAGTQKQFWTVLAAVSGGTYLVAIIVLSSVQQFRPIETVKSWFRPSSGMSEEGDQQPSGAGRPNKHLEKWRTSIRKERPGTQEQQRAGSGADQMNQKFKQWWASSRSKSQGAGQAGADPDPENPTTAAGPDETGV